MQRNYDLLLNVLDCFTNNYEQYENITFQAANGYTIYNVIEVKNHFLSFDENGNIIVYDAKSSFPKIDGALCIPSTIEYGAQLVILTRWLTKLNII